MDHRLILDHDRRQITIITSGPAEIAGFYRYTEELAAARSAHDYRRILVDHRAVSGGFEGIGFPEVRNYAAFCSRYGEKLPKLHIANLCHPGIVYGFIRMWDSIMLSLDQVLDFQVFTDPDPAQRWLHRLD